MPEKVVGLVAAAYTPMKPDGSLNLQAVELLAAHLQRQGVVAVFVNGTTGESHSLTIEERKALAGCWADALRGSPLKLFVHVGHNCVPEAAELAAHAQQVGAAGIAALSPSYFKPPDVATLVDCCAAIAAAAPGVPFYFYDIPSWTGVQLSMPQFLQQGRERIPTLAGIKYTNSDLAQFQQCLRLDEGAFDILFGTDEALLAGLTLGARGAIGSTYNFAAPLYHRVLQAFAAGDLESARREQACAVALVATIARYGYLAASKRVLAMLGVDLGPVRLPLRALPGEQESQLRRDLESLGFFDWINA